MGYVLNAQTDDDFSKMGNFEDDEITPINPDLNNQDDDPVDPTNNDPVEPTEPVEPVEPAEPVEPQHTELITKLLQRRGIVSPEKVLYEEEDGKVVEKNFYELPEEDQLQILDQEMDFSDEEMFYINQARENNISFTDLIQYHVQQQMAQSNTSSNTSINDYSDEELYVLDLKARQGENMTNEEILAALEKELESPELFKKKITVLRKEYQDLEEAEKAADLQRQEDLNKDRIREYNTTMTELITSVEDVGGVVLENQDKKDILDFLIKPDINGVTEFQKQMQDPEKVFLAAWAITKAEDTFAILKEFYENQIKQSKKVQVPQKPKVEVNSKKRDTAQIKSVEDLNTFDD